ncbi:hypothetical protein [Streptomyces spiralis]
MDDSLSFESFLRGAGKAAYKAMEDHGRSDYDEFALHGGVAVERLAKAALVKRNPVYLLDTNKGNPDLLLYFGGHLDMDPDKIRTVGAKDAIKRLRTLKVLPPGSQLDKLIELRNGTAHTTVGDEAKSLLPPLAETIETLLKDVGMSTEQFWGRWTGAVNIAVDKQRNEIQRDVEVRIRGARHLFEDRFKHLPEGTKERALSELPPTHQVIGITRGDGATLAVSILVPCPACEGSARVRITPDETEGDLVIRSDHFFCAWCSLQLDTPEEIEAASIEVEKYIPSSSVEITWATSSTAPPTGLRLERVRKH